MASNFDNMFSNQPYKSYNDGKKSGKKTVLFLILLLLIILLIVVVFIMIKYLGKKENVSSKTAFITYLSSENIESKINITAFSDIVNKLANNSNESDTDITISTNIEGAKELENYKATINTKFDKNNSRGLADVEIDYLDNSIFNLQALITGKSFAIKSDEIVTKYVGYKYENLLNTISSNSEEVFFDFENIDLNFLSSIQISSEFVNSEIQKYIQVLNNLTEDKFTQKNVTLEQKNGNIDSVVYILTLNEKEQIEILEQVLTELKNDDELIGIVQNLLRTVGEEVEADAIKFAIDSLISSLYDLEINEENLYSYSIYTANSQIVKMSIAFPTINIDIEFSTDESGTTTTFTVLDADRNNGVTIDFDRVSKDVSEKLALTFNLISEQEIITKVSFDIAFTGITSQTNMDIEANISYSDTTNEFNLNTITAVEFTSIEVEDLTNDNCLFLDELNEEQRQTVIDSIETRTTEVLTEKQNQINLIKSNTGSTVIEQNPDEENHDEELEKAQEKVINAVANEMYEAEESQQEYTVNDIIGLEIEGSDVEVTVENDVATVVIDGYTFTINSLFQIQPVE